MSGPGSGKTTLGFGNGAGLGVPLVAPFPGGLSPNQGTGQGPALRDWAGRVALLSGGTAGAFWHLVFDP